MRVGTCNSPEYFAGIYMSQLEDLTRQTSKPTLMSDLVYFFKHSKKWWMVPLIVVLLLFGTLMMLGGTAAAPFIYTLF